MFTINGQLDQITIEPKPILVNSPTLANASVLDNKKTLDLNNNNNNNKIYNNNDEQQQQQQVVNNMDDFEIKQPIGKIYNYLHLQ
jgi:hypothetical protein